MKNVAQRVAFAAIAVSVHQTKIFGSRTTAPREWDDVVEFDLVVSHWLVATLAYLTVTADDFQHDIPRNRAAVGSQVFRFGQRLRYEEDGA